LEVLLINDGSTDDSPAICAEYCARYPYMRLFSKENEGLSATRNYGIAHANGVYLMYLDSDDRFTPETIKNVCDFFDAHRDEVDLVAFPHIDYVNNVRGKGKHYRYKIMCESGVYDLEEYPYLAQTYVSVAVRNMGEENILFDTTPAFRHEDLKYSTQVLQRKMKMGYCAEAEYMYTKDNGGGIVSNFFHAYYIFESTMAFFEELFGGYADDVPAYVQGVLLNDLQYKLRVNMLFPYHYEPAAYEAALERIRVLLRRCSTEMVLKHPMMTLHQKLFWLKFAGKTDLQAEISDDGILVTADEQMMEDRKCAPLIIRRMRVRNGKLSFLGYINSTYFTVREDKTPELFAELDGKIVPIETFHSMHSTLHPLLETARMFAFRFSCDAAKVKQIKFWMGVSGQSQRLPAWMRFQPHDANHSKYRLLVRGNLKIKKRPTVIKLRKTSAFERLIVYMRNTVRQYKHPRLVMRRLVAMFAKLKKQRVWLYNDLYSVEADNGYYQFKHDFAKRDGVKRYYVIDRIYENPDAFFSPEERKHLIQKGSFKHKILYLRADRVLTAFFGCSPITPFTSVREELGYEDMMAFDVTYLQHGVLHAAMHTANHAERARADQIVVSTPFEFENYRRHYGYTADQLLCTGMPRYGRINRGAKPKNRVLLAPSWRKYLTQQINASTWDPNKKRIMASDYYKGFLAFLEDPRLWAMLEAHDMYLDVKPHPIIANTPGLFEIACDRVRVITEDPPPEDYKVFITDFSSYVFDFVYLERCITYFVPDYAQFKAGMNHYRALDLPLEDAFGPVAFDAGTAVLQLCALAARGFVPEKVHQDRMRGFFYPLEGGMDALYEQLRD
jgi:glycosyltransferase involved in cell wall biosynthesis/CDP-glycerol glycerophosphotransferase (TagB/SpsB family)